MITIHIKTIGNDNFKRVLSIRYPDDFHVHFRQGLMLHNVINHTAAQFKRAMVMPNTEPAIKNGDDVKRYYQEIMDALDPENHCFQPLMTFKITPSTTINDIQSVVGLVIAGKLYPDGVTTNSEGGVTDYQALYPIFEAMQEHKIILSLHGEKSNTFCLDREEQFLSILCQITQDFPRLKIVLEHISTKAAVDLIEKLPDTVAATITLHHLELTLDDVIGSLNNPHNFCKPIAKRKEDREALRKAAFSCNPKFFFGSDSAPHLRTNKECSSGCAGIFSAPVLIPSLISLFEKYDTLNLLEDFVSRFGAEFYGLPLNEDKIYFIENEWQVPLDYSGIVAYKSGEYMAWQIYNIC